MTGAPDKTRIATVPEGRAQRLLHFGRAVGEMAAGAVAQGVVQLAQGQRPDVGQLLFSPGNAQRLAERLSRMRGAVMKVGQLMSMDGQGVLPPQFAELLGGLRDQAHTMPATQFAEVLEREYGPLWHQRFRRLSYEPVSRCVTRRHRDRMSPTALGIRAAHTISAPQPSSPEVLSWAAISSSARATPVRRLRT